MKSICTEKLRNMQVVNVCNGEILGYPSDFELSVGACLTVSAIIIRGSKGFFGIGKKEDLYIQWDTVSRIGEDAILVNIPECNRNHRKTYGEL